MVRGWAEVDQGLAVARSNGVVMTSYDYGVVAVVMVQVVTALVWVALYVARGERSGE